MTTAVMVHSPASDEPNVFFWDVSAHRLADVEAELVRLQFDPSVAASEFYRPWRECGQWRTTGFTRLHEQQQQEAHDDGGKAIPRGA